MWLPVAGLVMILMVQVSVILNGISSSGFNRRAARAWRVLIGARAWREGSPLIPIGKRIEKRAIIPAGSAGILKIVVSAFSADWEGEDGNFRSQGPAGEREAVVSKVKLGRGRGNQD